MLLRLRTSLAAFAGARGGNISMMFGLALLPMIVFIGLGVDTSRTLSAKSSFDAAADAAALAAATEAEAILQSPLGQAQTDKGVGLAQSGGSTAGQLMFTSDAKRAGAWAGGTPNPTITIGIANQIITATVSYTAAVPTTFGGIVNVRTMAITGTASSSLSLPKYMNISVAIDVSQSMGLAATQDDMTKLKTLTNGCAFGCHVYQSGQSGSDPYEVQAHNAGIQLRIDVIRTATQNMIQTAKSIQGSSGMISFGLYTIQGGASYGGGQPFTTLASPSTNYDSLNTAAGNIDLGPNTSAGVGDTDLPSAMTSLKATVPTSGDGSSSSKAQQFVFLLTDGVQDIANGTQNCTDNVWSHCTGPIDPSTCADMRSKGITVGVIYTTYLSMPDRTEYTHLVQDFADQIPTQLQSCATPGYFYEAQDGPDIQVAINALFAKATGSGVLTQ